MKKNYRVISVQNVLLPIEYVENNDGVTGTNFRHNSSPFILCTICVNKSDKCRPSPAMTKLWPFISTQNCDVS